MTLSNLEQKFHVGQKIVVKKRNFDIISVSKVFKDNEHVNYFVVGQNKKTYVAFCQISQSSEEEEIFKIVTENSMYAGMHYDLPKKKKRSLF
jgi:hypothetical protein